MTKKDYVAIGDLQARLNDERREAQIIYAELQAARAVVEAAEEILNDRWSDIRRSLADKLREVLATYRALREK